MKKIILFTVLLAVLAAGFVSADGWPGNKGSWNNNDNRNYSGRGGYMMDYGNSPCIGNGPGFSSFTELKEVSGEIVLNEDDFPAIKTGKDVMTITLPADAIEALKIKTGSKITAKGVEMPGRNWSITGEKLFRIFEFEYEGKTYITHGMGGRPERGGMRGGF